MAETATSKNSDPLTPKSEVSTPTKTKTPHTSESFISDVSDTNTQTANTNSKPIQTKKSRKKRANTPEEPVSEGKPKKKRKYCKKTVDATNKPDVTKTTQDKTKQKRKPRQKKAKAKSDTDSTISEDTITPPTTDVALEKKKTQNKTKKKQRKPRQKKAKAKTKSDTDSTISEDTTTPPDTLTTGVALEGGESQPKTPKTDSVAPIEDLGVVELGDGDDVVTMKRLHRRGPFANQKGKVVLPGRKPRYYDKIKSDAARKRLTFLGAYDKTKENGLTANDIAWNGKKRRFVNKHVSEKAKSNKWMIALSKARESNLDSFKYNENYYVRDVTTTGMTIYKRQKTEE